MFSMSTLVYFVSQSIPPHNNMPLPNFTYTTEARLAHIDITPDLVTKTLKDINKACGPDKINNRVLKARAQSLSVPLSFIFQKSLNQGYFPDS